jgi:hypothetical protein
MSLINTTDIHLTDDPNHAYRWRIFQFLQGRARAHLRRGSVPSLIISGDMTESKEKHSAQLVNRFAQEISILAEGYFKNIYLMRGNHDYKPGEGSFFRFMRYMKKVWWADGIFFGRDGMDGKKFVLVPHGCDLVSARADCKLEKPDFAFLHHTFVGAKGSNGYELTAGAELKLVKGIAPRIFSGDIHTRQKLGSVIHKGRKLPLVEYIGTPYPIDFDEDHECRVIEIDEAGKVTSVPTNIIRKHTLTVRNARDLEKQLRATSSGDQVKVRWHMSAADLSRASELYHVIADLCGHAEVGLTGGVEYLFDETTGPHSMAVAFDEPSKENSASVMQILNQFVTVRRLRAPLIKTGRKIVQGKSRKKRPRRSGGDPFSPKGACF